MPSPVRRLQEGVARAVAQADSVEGVQTAAASVLVPRFDVALTVWSTIDPADLLGTSCRLFARDMAALPVGPAELVRERALFELEWLDTDPNTFASLRRSGRIAAGLRADVGDPSSVTRYHELLAPLGVFDELRIVLRDGDDVWGSAILYRDNGPFTPQDVATVAACAPVLARALRRCLLSSAAEHAALDSPPGTLVLDANDHVVITSPAAEDLLAGLDDQHVRTALVAVAAGARVNGDVCTTVIGRDRVIALHAAPAKGLEGGVTVVVERPRPSQLTPLILRALGLTARERGG